MTLGTPGMKFLVALDTGSDLFWVPCECGKCASTDDPTLYSSVCFTLPPSLFWVSLSISIYERVE